MDARWDCGGCIREPGLTAQRGNCYGPLTPECGGTVEDGLTVLHGHLIPGLPPDRGALFLTCPEGAIRTRWTQRVFRAARAVSSGLPLDTVEPYATSILAEAVTLVLDEQNALEAKRIKAESARS